jgi:hypothetical protein
MRVDAPECQPGHGLLSNAWIGQVTTHMHRTLAFAGDAFAHLLMSTDRAVVERVGVQDTHFTPVK